MAAAGAVGGSIEDYDPEGGFYDLEHATERIAAAVEAARDLDFPFTLTARAENFFRGNPDLDDTLARLLAYERAGADVLYAPRLPGSEEIRAIRSATSRPLNVLARVTPLGGGDHRVWRPAHQRWRPARLGRDQLNGRRRRGGTRRGRTSPARRSGSDQRLALRLSEPSVFARSAGLGRHGVLFLDEAMRLGREGSVVADQAMRLPRKAVAGLAGVPVTANSRIRLFLFLFRRSQSNISPPGG